MKAEIRQTKGGSSNRQYKTFIGIGKTLLVEGLRIGKIVKQSMYVDVVGNR